MSAEVVLLGGATIASQGNPDQAVVEEIEMLLEAARSGRITGITYAVDYTDNSNGCRHVGTYGRGMVGALFCSVTRLARMMDP